MVPMEDDNSKMDGLEKMLKFVSHLVLSYKKLLRKQISQQVRNMKN